MADYGSSDTSTTSLGTNQFPISEVYVANTKLTALGGGPKQTDGAGKDYAPVLVYVQDGSDVTQGLSTDANTVNSVMGRLTKIRDLLLATLTISGTVTANVGTTNGLALDTSVNGVIVAQGSATSGEKGPLIQGAVTTSAPTYTTGQTSPLSLTTAGALRVDNSANTQPVSGSISVSNFPGTQPVSGTITANQGGTWNITNISGTVSLPTGAATSAKQPALGTAGTASSDVLSVQGIASMTALKTDGSGVTQPVSGTVTVQQSTASSLKVDLSGTGANATALKVDGSAVTQPVSGTITANAGTGTFTNQQSNITTDYDTGAGTQTMTMFGVALPASGGSVAGGTSSNPLRTDPTGSTTQPVSGTVSITANSAVNVAQVAGTTTDTNSGNKSAGTQRIVIATDQPQLTNALKVDGSAVTQPVSGTFWQATQPVSGTITANIGTTNGLALDASVTGLQVAQGSTTSGQKGGLILGAVTTNAPSYTTAQTSPLSLDTSGLLRASLKDTPSNTNNLNVNLAASGITQPVSGTITANAGSGTFTNQQSNITADYDSGAGTQTMTMFGMALPASGGAVAGGTSTNPVRTDPTGTTTQPVSGTVTANQGGSNWSINNVQVNGTTIDTNSGTKSAGTQRVILATDQPALTNKLLVTPDSVALPAHQSVNVDQWNGTTADTNSGTKSAGTLRVVLATDQPALTNALKVDGSAVTQPVSGTVTSNVGTPAGSSSFIFKEVKNTSITAGTGLSIWTPTSGKKFRLLGMCLSCSDATGKSAIFLQDTVTINSANEFMRLPRTQSTNITPVQHRFGPNGYLSTTANNQLWIDVSTTESVEGYVYGSEE